MVNLLPSDARRTLFVRYYVRVLTVMFLGMAAVALVGAVFLIPSYLLARANADAASRSLDVSKQAVAAGARGGAPAQFALLSERVSILSSYQRPPIASRILSAISSALPKGTAIVKVVVTPASDAPSGGTIVLSGVAPTRDDLVTFVSALQGVPIFSGVSVPVSDLAGGTDIPFTLSFSFIYPQS